MAFRPLCGKMASSKTMKSRKEKLRKKVHVMEWLSLAISLYICGIYVSFANQHMTVNPISVILNLIVIRFPVVLFLFVYCATMLICTLLLAASARDDETGSDSMHPKRKLSDKGIYGTAKFEQPWDYRSLAQIRPI